MTRIYSFSISMHVPSFLCPSVRPSVSMSAWRRDRFCDKRDSKTECGDGSQPFHVRIYSYADTRRDVLSDSHKTAVTSGTLRNSAVAAATGGHWWGWLCSLKSLSPNRMFLCSSACSYLPISLSIALCSSVLYLCRLSTADSFCPCPWLTIYPSSPATFQFYIS